MGERLVFKCIKDERCFATLYFHWSGYTASVYREAVKLINGLRRRGYNIGMPVPEIQKMLADILYEDFCTGQYTINGTDINVGPSHGGINDDPAEYAAFEAIGYDTSKVDTKELNRSDGLIDITESGMGNAIHWAEHLEEIDFDSMTFTNDQFYYDDAGQFVEDYEEDISELDIWDPPAGFTGTISWNDAEQALNWFYDLYEYRGKWILGKTEDDTAVVTACM